MPWLQLVCLLVESVNVPLMNQTHTMNLPDHAVTTDMELAMSE